MSLTLAMGKQDALGTGVEGDLQRLGQVLDRDDVAAQAHAAQDDHLLLERLAQDAGAEGHERRQGHGRRRPGVVQLDDVQVVVVVAGLDRGADPAGVGLEVVEADLDGFLGRRVRAEARRLQRAVARVTWVSRR